MQFYNQEKIKEFIEKGERLIYVDDGINEFLIRYKDIPDVIVDYYYKSGGKDLKLYDANSMDTIITTYGFFLDYCDKRVREDIIDRLAYLQQGGRTKKYKIINEEDFNTIKSELCLNDFRI